MSYNGSGTFQINTSGQPVVTGTVISSSAFNALTADLATGLSTAITKDGQTATTVRIPFAQGINSSLTTDTSSGSTGSIFTAGGVGIAKALFVGTTLNYGGVTLSAAVTGTGKMVLDTSPTLVTPALGTPSSGILTNCTGINYNGFKNRIINGQLNINQRGVSGTVTLAAGDYGHDRFKGGASGCTYTFATSNNVTTLTISAGSLIQVVEGLNLESGTYTLSFTGTAQGKIGAGSFSASGVTGSITGGTDTNIEFNTGTLSLPQLEKGSTATSFDYRPYGTELVMCQRYCQVIGGSVSNQMVATSWSPSTTSSVISCLRPVQMRASPTLTYSALGDWQVFNGGAGTVTPTSIVQNRPSSQSISMEFGFGVFTVIGQTGAVLAQSINAKLIESAEL
jgi:hypothetical protein